MRYISPDTFTDEIIAKDLLSLTTWIGMIASIADDQGRMLDNPALIRSMLFPYDEKITTASVEVVLKYFEHKHKITRYIAGTNGTGRKLIQINSWWKYQRSSQWAGQSSYPSPKNWIDRVRAHVPGGKILALNWENEGGYLPTTKTLHRSDTTKPLHSGKKGGYLLRDVNDDVKGNDKVDGEGGVLSESIKLRGQAQKKKSPPRLSKKEPAGFKGIRKAVTNGK